MGHLPIPEWTIEVGVRRPKLRLQWWTADNPSTIFVWWLEWDNRGATRLSYTFMWFSRVATQLRVATSSSSRMLNQRFNVVLINCHQKPRHLSKGRYFATNWSLKTKGLSQLVGLKQSKTCWCLNPLNNVRYWVPSLCCFQLENRHIFSPLQYISTATTLDWYDWYDMGFSRNGGPQNGWFITENPNLEWMRTGTTPITQETPWYDHPIWSPWSDLTARLQQLGAFQAHAPPGFGIGRVAADASRLHAAVPCSSWLSRDFGHTSRNKTRKHAKKNDISRTIMNYSMDNL